MRICYVADAASIHTQRWASHFAQHHDVHVLSFREAAIPGVEVYTLGSLKVLGKARYPLQAPRARRLLRKIDPDVVHSMALTSYGFVAALTGRRPLITSVWGYDILQAPHRSPLHLWITRYGLRKADLVTATGDALAEATRPFMPREKAIHVVPYGIDLDDFAPATVNGAGAEPPWEPALGAGGPVIASVKALRVEKGFNFLISAMADVVKRHPEATLVLAGDGPERHALEQQARALGLAGRVQFLGDVSHARVPELLRHVDIYVQPSLTESFGVSALEASATGLPVIATAVEGGRDIVRDGETGFLTPPSSSAALSDAIIRLLDDPGLGRSLGEAGRRFVAERYQWRDNADQMEALYREVIAGYGGGGRQSDAAAH